MKIGWLALFGALVASSATADTTAIYDAQNGAFKMTVEIASNGDLRGNVAAKPGVYFLALHGEGFAVLSLPSGVVVDRVEDLVAAVGKVAAEKMPRIKDLDLSQVPKMEFVAGAKQVNVNGRLGTPYFWKGDNAQQQPVMVISLDPALAPLGQAMSKQFQMSAQLSSAIFGQKVPGFDEMIAVVRSGAPLQYAGAALRSVNNDPIPSERFVLPKAPEPPSTIEARVRSTATDHSVVAF